MIDIPKLLDAIAEVESTSGRNDYPRFEPAYAPAGQVFTVQGRLVTGTGRAFSPVAAERWQRWGMASAASYSRWQILYHTAADLGYPTVWHPAKLWSDDDIAEAYVTRFIERQIARGVTTVRQLADAYNSGNAHDAVVPTDYIDKVVAAYVARGGAPDEPVVV